MADSTTHGTLLALVIDDEQQTRELVSEVLRSEGWKVSESPSTIDALERLHEAPWSVVFCDVMLGGANSYRVLRTFKEKLPGAKVVLMAAHGHTTGALDSSAFGAYDYFLKSFGAEELELLSQLLREQLSDRPPRTSPTRRTAACLSDIDLVGRSQTFIALLKHMRRVSNTNLPVLLIGESGTGRALIASTIHQRSGRADRPFIFVKCRELAVEPIEVELWERANGGTVFLDEITDMDWSFQTTLLPLLKSGEIRVIAATSRNVEQEIAAGKFREDLFSILNAVSVKLPPLRQRREDIPPLAQSFAVEVYSLNAPVKFSTEAMALLQRYTWPGNVRELENAVVRAVAVCDGTIRVKDLPHRVRQYSGRGSDIERTNGGDQSTHEEWVPLSEIEGRYVAKVLEHTRGNKQAAARVLGVDRKTLDRMIRRHHIETQFLRERAKSSAADNSGFRG
jgi:DNA-binding NtrC family response regulator